jgi:hypothetical protein
MSSTSGLEVAPRREGPAAEGVDERRGQRPGKRVRSGELEGGGEGSAAAAHQQGGRADRKASAEGDGSQRAGTWEETPELLLAMGLNAEEGLRQVRGTLDEVEDQLSGVVKKDPPPPPNMSDGRMYPPLDDFVVRHPDGRITATTRGYKIEIGADGEVVIRNKKTGDIELRKP